MGLLALTGCEKTLEQEKIAQAIQDDIIKQGGISLKSVTCPKGIKPEAEKTFDCIGETDQNYTFTIPVKQKDEQGNVSWDVPNAKGLLNVAKFETSIQESVSSELGTRPIIRCGDGYRPIKSGQIFECRVLVKDQPKDGKKDGDSKEAAKPAIASSPKTSKDPKEKPSKAPKPDKVVVSVDADGNVSWQLVMQGSVSQLLPKPAQPAAATSTPAQTIAPTSATRAIAPPPPAQKSADDFLNQPGAADNF